MGPTCRLYSECARIVGEMSTMTIKIQYLRSTSATATAGIPVILDYSPHVWCLWCYQTDFVLDNWRDKHFDLLSAAIKHYREFGFRLNNGKLWISPNAIISIEEITP